MDGTGLDYNHQYWWRTCQPALSALFDFTGSYTEEQKENHMKWVSQHVLPWFGEPHSRTCGISLTRDKSPIEISLNLATNRAPMIRFGVQLVGVGLDAFDFSNKLRLLEPLFATASDKDMRWFDSMGKAMFITDPVMIKRAKALTPPVMQEQPPTLALGFGLDGRKRKLKAYVFPLVKSWATGVPSDVIIRTAIQNIQPCGTEFSKSMDLVEQFLADNSRDKMTLTMIGIDCIDPMGGAARAKIYGNVYTSNSWTTVQNVYTLGGRVEDPARMIGLGKLKSVWHLLRCESEPPADHHSKPLRDTSSPHGAFTSSLEMTPGCAVPEVKIYVSVWQYGKDDYEIAQNIMKALRVLGFQKEADKYLDLLKRAL